MKRWILLILLATPALAQDEPGGAGDDFFNLESMGNFEDLGPEFDALVPDAG